MSKCKTSPEKTQEEPLRTVAGTGLCGDNDDDRSGQSHKQEKQHFFLSLQGSTHFLNMAERYQNSFISLFSSSIVSSSAHRYK